MRTYLKLTALLFGIVAVVHGLRLAQHWPLAIAGWDVPLWVSWIGIAVPGALCAWAVRLLAKECLDSR